jgi:hypothetical protein
MLRNSLDLPGAAGVNVTAILCQNEI